ncbi:MAG: hypothetical protein HYY35_05405 [Deltaproteobacteria bacterium]|nr:hypothetical protein [Deltaproteobacteria bacterium]
MNRRRVLTACLAGAALLRGAAFAEAMADLVRQAVEAGKPSTPLRADATADIDGLDGKRQERLVIVERVAADAGLPAQTLVVLAGAKLRVLALGPAELHLASGGKVSRAEAKARIGSTSFAAEDFLPFSPARCAAMRLADLTAEQFTLVCEPKIPPSQYSLMVYKFDRARFSLLQVLLYRDGMTNLVKMLRNHDFVRVGSAWRPKRVVMQDFKLRTKDVLSLEWRESADVPAEAFDAKSFAGVALEPRASAQP